MISVEDAMQQIKRGTDEILVESELQEKLKRAASEYQSRVRSDRARLHLGIRS